MVFFFAEVLPLLVDFLSFLIFEDFSLGFLSVLDELESEEEDFLFVFIAAFFAESLPLDIASSSLSDVLSSFLIDFSFAIFFFLCPFLVLPTRMVAIISRKIYE